MGVSSSTSSSNRLPWAAIGALVICVIFEVLVVANRPLFLFGIETVAHTKRDLLLNADVNPDVVILGDSRLFSVRADRLEEALGGDVSVLNLAWPYMGVEGLPYVLDALLAAKPAPELIVIGIGLEHLAYQDKEMSIATNEHNRTRAFTVIPGTTLVPSLAADGSWHLLWSYIEFRLLPPSNRHRYGFRAWFNQSVTSRPMLDAWNTRVIEDMRTTGSFILADGVFDDPTWLEGVMEVMGDIELWENEMAREMMDRCVAMAAEAGVPMLLVDPPTPQSVIARMEEQGVVAAYREIVEGWERDYDTFEAFEPLSPGRPDVEFGDVAHVNEIGDEYLNARFEEALVEYMQDL